MTALPKPTDPAGKPSRFMRLVLTVDLEIKEGKRPTMAELSDGVVIDLEEQWIKLVRGIGDNETTEMKIQAVYTPKSTLPGRKVAPAILGQITEEN